jgi:hypothetical protein
MKYTCAVKGSQPKTKITYKNQNKPQTEQLNMTFATSAMGEQTSHNACCKRYFSFYVL